MTKRRSMRLRKKLRVDEFQEHGFQWLATLKEPLSAEDEETFINAFLAQVIEPRGLAFGGWVSGGYVCTAVRGSATEDDRAAVTAWLQSRTDIAKFQVSEMNDAWFGSSSDIE